MSLTYDNLFLKSADSLTNSLNQVSEE